MRLAEGGGDFEEGCMVVGGRHGGDEESRLELLFVVSVMELGMRARERQRKGKLLE